MHLILEKILKYYWSKKKLVLTFMVNCFLIQPEIKNK